MTGPKALTPKHVLFTNGILAGASDTGKVHVWDHSDGGVRLLVVGRRHLVVDVILHILVDEAKVFMPFRPGLGLIDGDPLDVVFASTEPLNAEKMLTIDLTADGKRARLGSYSVQKQWLVAKDVTAWNLVYGFPFPAATAETIERQRETRALRDNCKVLKNHWPQLRAPAIATAPNLEVPLPDLQHRQRVSGRAPQLDPDGSQFIEYGYVQLRSVLSIAEVYGCQLGADTTTLDWGVGCGRIARHLPPILQSGFAGIDVDPVNIGWCQQNMPFGRFETVDPYARTGFADGQFDLIYSHSVLTHLSEQDQFQWLEELARISRGLMILSVSGLFGAQFVRWSRSPDKLWKFLVNGFSHAKDALPDIQDVTPPGYYRSTSHTPAYIYAKWSRFVDVVDIISGGFGTRQDAVICRPHAHKQA